MRLLIPSSLALASALLLAPPAASAQSMVQALPGTTDADRLADTMRRLAVSPNDLGALLDAGELSLKVDDLSGAASLFARADKVDPRSARAKAGMAAILVRAERPGEALRYFQQAEGLGLSADRMAADRGLAYDLVGQQERAQRDYRLALRYGSDDEVLRRYALSLGISGRREQAIAVLDPLIRRADRGAWRARAFILAMTGDVPGATTIATTMMPAGMAQGLLPFFQRLPNLPATDRAFAIHFGEVRATPERLADARLTPILAPLPPEPQMRPVVVAALAQPVTANDRRRGRNRRDRQTAPIVTASAATPAAPVSAPVPQRPAVRPTAPQVLAAAQPVRVIPAPVRVEEPRRTMRPSAGVAVSALSVQPLPPANAPVPTRVAAAVQPVPVQAAPVLSAAPAVLADRGTTPAPGFGPLAATTPVVPSVPSATAPATTSTPIAEATTVPVRVADLAPAPVSPIVSPATERSTVVAASTVAPEPVPSVVTPAAAPMTVASTAAPPVVAPQQDSVLARIIANLSIPGTELGVAAPARMTRTPAPELAQARAKAAEDTAERQTAIARIARANGSKVSTKARGEELAQVDPDLAAPTSTRGRRGARSASKTDDAVQEEVTPAPTRGRRGARSTSKVDDTADDEATATATRGRRGARGAGKADDAAPEEATSPTRQARGSRGKGGEAADKRARNADAEADKTSKGKRVPADKRDTPERKTERDEPERIWVQVATGANEGDLPKAWSSVRSKAPDAFRNRAGYTTPLRATNRVATGPFKTKEEAQAFVNALAKKGVSASTFTSEAGQKIAKLPAGK